MDAGRLQVRVVGGSIRVRSVAFPYELQLDDTPEFRQPVLSRSVDGQETVIDALDAALSPGTRYYVRAGPNAAAASFDFRGNSWSEPYLSASYVRAAWERAGRAWLREHGGAAWSARDLTWRLTPGWTGDPAHGAYYLQYATEVGVNMAWILQDTALVGELAQFLSVYTQRITTLGALRAAQKGTPDAATLDRQGGDSYRTFPWVETTEANDTRIRECTLCNSQFFHPAARLLRLITTLPASARTTGMASFAALYGPLIAHDHLLRLLYEAQWPGEPDLPDGPLVDRWAKVATSSSTTRNRHPMQDTDLWLIAAAAEILGAHANDPDLVRLSTTEVDGLRRAVETGVRLFRSKQDPHPDTRDRQGNIVGSMSYFGGDFDGHPDNAYTAVSGCRFPTPADAAALPGVSWDVSHFTRVPVFLRALYDNRKATGLSFPRGADIRLLTNHLMYVTFQGDFRMPLLNNMFDGSNGWYRVGPHGESGYPPAQCCDSRGGSKWLCLEAGWVQGWGLISFVHAELRELYHQLAKLAWSTDPEQVAFRGRYFSYSGESYKAESYPTLLLWVLGGAVENLNGT